MRPVIQAAVVVLAGLAWAACIAEAQILKNRKPGLWELQYSGEDRESGAQQSQMAERLANMSPEQRAQMEAYMKERGMGVGAGPGGRPTMTIRFCLTPQEIADDSGRSFMRGGMDKGECTPKILSQSASEIHIHTTCRGRDGTPTEMDARIFDVAPDHYAVDMTGKGPRGDMRMQQKARWLSADCKGAAY